VDFRRQREAMSADTAVVAVEAITSRFLTLRGQRVIADADLAAL
jgi:hypothetical protein